MENGENTPLVGPEAGANVIYPQGSYKSFAKRSTSLTRPVVTKTFFFSTDMQLNAGSGGRTTSLSLDSADAASKMHSGNGGDRPLLLAAIRRDDAASTSSDEDASDASSSSPLSHCHARHAERKVENRRARRTLIAASSLCLVFMVAEVIGGYLAGSLAIMTDAAHLLTDFASFLISLFSLFVASRPATRRMSFGWHRAEVLGAFLSVLLIWIITGVLVYMAIERIVNKTYDIHAKYMLITAAVGVFVNVIMGILLHQGGHGHSHGGSTSSSSKSNNTTAYTNGHLNNNSGSDDWLIDDTVQEFRPHSSERNINVRAAFIHVLGDFFQSVGVLIAAYVIFYHPELTIIDPICTFVFSAVVLLTTVAIMRDALNILMEGSPKSVDFVQVAEALSAVPGVIRVHNLRIWSLTLDKAALSVHLAVAGGDGDPAAEAAAAVDGQRVLRDAVSVLRRRFNIFECTVQIEHYSQDMEQCARCEHPKS